MIDPEWQDARRLLLVRLDNLGDVLVTTPAFRAVRHSLPEVRLTLLCSPVGAQVGRLNRDIDEVMEYEAPWMDPWSQLAQDPSREQALIRHIAAGRFDGAIIFTSFRQSSLPAAYMCYLAGIPHRAAASVDGSGSLLTTRIKHQSDSSGSFPHEVQRSLDLVGALGMTTDDLSLELHVSPEVQAYADDLVASVRAQEAPVVVVHPGCSMPARTYAWEGYADICRGLVRNLGARVLLTGSAAERDLVARVQDRSGLSEDKARSLAGDLSIELLAGIIGASDLIVTNNTGPAHIAAAVGTPVLTLFALTNPPDQWAPWQVPYRQLFHDVPCRTCYSRICPFSHECLALVSPNQVVEAAASLLSALGQGVTVTRRADDSVAGSSEISAGPAYSFQSRDTHVSATAYQPRGARA